MSEVKEYGGYLAFEEYNGEEHYKNSLAFDSLRSALAYVVKKRNYRKVLLPRYLCGCMAEFLDTLGIPYGLYHIGIDFAPLLEHSVASDECLFFVNYFGQFSSDWIRNYSKEYPTLFVDNTQAFFEPSAKGVDTARSCRKFIGVPDGAYLDSGIDAGDYAALPRDVSYQRMIHLLGRFESAASVNYKFFDQNDNMPRGNPIKSMSRLTRNLLRGADYARIKRRRTGNFEYLHKTLSGYNQLEVRNRAGLFLYPLLIENGAQIKKELIRQHIYVPTLWPNLIGEADEAGIEDRFVQDLVLLPIDQRYGEEDMSVVLDTVLKALKEA